VSGPFTAGLAVNLDFDRRIGEVGGDIGAVEWWPSSVRFPIVVALTLAGTIVCAAISYYALERPLMRWGKRRFGSAAPANATSEVAP